MKKQTARIVVALLLVGGFVGVELFARSALLDPVRGLAVDVQAVSHLKPKIDIAIKEKENGNIVVALVGDSLWHGATMKEHGNENWRDFTLDRQLEKKLAELSTVTSQNNSTGQTSSKKSIKIINFGINGLLPKEIEVLARELKKIGIRGVVIDIGLRSVSADFAPPNNFSREWLKTFTVDGEKGDISFSQSSNDPLNYSASRIENYFLNNFSLVGLRAVARQYLFGGSPSELSARWAKTKMTDPAKVKQTPKAILQLRAKQRYRTASFDPKKSHQANAYVQTLKLADKDFFVISVYANLNPNLSKTIVRNKKLNGHKKILKVTNTNNLNAYSRFIADIPNLVDAHFLDLVHVDRSGYKEMARAIAPPLLELTHSN